MGQLFRKLTVAAALVVSAACTTSQTQVPGVTGPSELALSIRVIAIPDSMSQDGASQSSIEVTAFDANGKTCSGLPVRMDMSVGGSIQDFGTLSARNIVTGTDGKAHTVYTAPPPPPPATAGSGTTVIILATPSSSVNCNTNQAIGNFDATNRQQVAIRLVPPGVILAPPDTPVAQFIITPSPVNLNVPTTFDASTSCGVSLVNNVCPQSVGNSVVSQIVSYSWDFGDGGTGSGRTAQHTFKTVGSFNVTLTVTNDRGLSASSRQSVATAASAAPNASFVVSQTLPVVGQTVFFNGDASRATPGHSIVSWTWDFGDGITVNGGNLFSTSHAFTVSGTYTVVLSVLDDTGQKGTSSATLVVGTGNPIPSFILSPGSPKVGQDVLFDASGTQVFGGATIQSYQWTFAGAVPSSSPNGPQATTKFFGVGDWEVTLTVVDSLGRRGSTSQTVTVVP